MKIINALLTIGLITIGLQSNSATQLTAPPAESLCNPAVSGWNRGGCSSNADCVCHTLGGGEARPKGMCSSTMVSCSVLTPCDDDLVTCKRPETICVLDHRCSNKPLCYPIALANLAICPPAPPANLTVVTEPESEITICKEATWNSAVMVAGTGVPGIGLNEVDFPQDVFVEEDQTLYIADTSNHRIIKKSSTDIPARLVAGGRGAGSAQNQLYNPTGVLVTKTGDLIICDQGNRRIQVWARGAMSGNTLIDQIACQQLLVDQSGDLLFTTYDNEIYRWLPTQNTTKLVMKAGGKNTPSSQSYMFLAKTGNVYVADNSNHRILKYAPGKIDADIVVGEQTGQVLTEFNRVSYPKSVAVDDKGTIYVCDEGRGNIGRITRWAVGETEGSPVAEGWGFQKLRFDGKGNLYVSGFQVYRLDINNSACNETPSIPAL